MLEELQIFQDPEFDDSIIREEIRTYHPFVKSFANNDEIEIVIYQQDALLLMSEAALVIEGSLVKTNGSTGDIQFTTNCGAYLFDSITYKLNGKEVDKVRDPGTVSTIRGYLCHNKNDETLNAARWNYPESQLVTYDPLKSTFFLRIPLRHLFGLFYDFKILMFGKHVLRLIRARNDRNCFQVSKDDTDGVLTITNIELKVKHVFLNDVLKLKLLTEINKDKPILIPYRQWEYHELPSLTNGTSKEIWSIKTCTNLESPRYHSKVASTLYVIDCSKRNDAIKTSTIDIKLEIESRKSLPANTKACIVVHDRILESLPLSGVTYKAFANEIAIMNALHTAHYLLKSPFPYNILSADVKKQVRYLEQHYHGLKYDEDGSADIVYVKGHQKEEFLRKKFNEIEEEEESESAALSIPIIVNIENLSSTNEAVVTYPAIEYALMHYAQAEKLCSLLLLGSIDMDQFCGEMIEAGFYSSLFSIEKIIPKE
ncbi:hypothetical protein NQ317_017553 [Molorchus minor]|uniref:Double jelly roll-like domain-containing protein n=1 Tax=Molorchus minor TaxID=1323400 RepID=A0ABQ9J064_9CUCU|nr:hypothetical protein NQ317_017553 [Molorchus minor]